MAFVVDSSGSIRRKYWKLMKLFMRDVVERLKPSSSGSRMALMLYSSKPKLSFTFNTLLGKDINQKNILKYIDAMPHLRGLTFIDKALKLANEEIFSAKGGMRPEVKRVRINFIGVGKALLQLERSHGAT